MWVCRSLSVENARWPKASVNLAHKVDEWIDELTIAPENAGDVLDYIISRKKSMLLLSNGRESIPSLQK